MLIKLYTALIPLNWLPTWRTTTQMKGHRRFLFAQIVLKFQLSPDVPLSAEVEETSHWRDSISCWSLVAGSPLNLQSSAHKRYSLMHWDQLTISFLFIKPFIAFSLSCFVTKRCRGLSGIQYHVAKQISAGTLVSASKRFQLSSLPSYEWDKKTMFFFFFIQNIYSYRLFHTQYFFYAENLSDK